jgi:hypothetical protein
MSFRIAGPRLLLLGLQLFGRKSRREGKGTLSVTGETRRLCRAKEDEEPLQGMDGIGDVGPRNPGERRGNLHKLEA